MHANAMMQCNATSCEICMICTNACMPANKGDGCYTSSSFSIAGSIDGCFRLLSPCMHVTCVATNRERHSLDQLTRSLPPRHVQIYTYMIINIQLSLARLHRSIGCCCVSVSGQGANYIPQRRIELTRTSIRYIWCTYTYDFVWPRLHSCMQCPSQ